MITRRHQHLPKKALLSSSINAHALLWLEPPTTTVFRAFSICSFNYTCEFTEH